MELVSIIQGYAQGYFLMPNEQDKLSWYSSKERTLIPLDNRFRYPKSLQRKLNQNCFTTAINRDFLGVCYGCANRESTWITPELIEIYLTLNKAGFAYSFETWQNHKLAGGILGIVIGAVFIGESMFYNISDGSKVAMVKLVEHLRKKRFVLFDAQMQNPHLERFGSFIIDDMDYKILLGQSILKRRSFI